MQNTEEGRAARKLMKVNNNRFRYAMRLKLLEWAGRRDGRRGLPRLGEDAQWNSPRIAQILGDFSTLEATVYYTLQSEMISAHVRLSEHVDMIEALRERYRDQAKILADFEAAPVECLPGEERLPREVIRDRRRQELFAMAGLAPLALRSELEERIRHAIEINAQIHQIEVMEELYAKLAETNVALYLAAYWRGIMRTNKVKDLPACPPEHPCGKAPGVYNASREATVSKLLAIVSEMKGGEK